MAVRIGDNGGIRIAPETTYGTAGTVYTVLHAQTSSLGHRKEIMPPGRLTAVAPSTRKYGVGYADGDIGLAYDNHRSVMGDLLEAAGNLATNDYTIGDGSDPDTESLTIWVDVDGFATRYTGAVLNSLVFTFAGNAPVSVVASFLCQGTTIETAVTLTAPDEAGIVWDADIGGITIGGATMCSLSGTIDVQFNLQGSDRHCLGGSTMKKPVRVGRAVITASLTVELSDDTGADSEAELASFLAGTGLGAIVVGDFELTDCYMTGEWAGLAEGITQFPINAEAGTLVITTVA